MRGNPNWKPGVSGNPGGKPKGTVQIRTLLQHRLLKAVSREDREKAGKKIVNELVRLACQGDITAIKEVFDRLEGKAKQSTEHTGTLRLVNFEASVPPLGDVTDDAAGE